MWKDLNMKEKAALMRIAVNSGVHNIDDIVNTYNYATGGFFDSPPTNTPYRSTSTKKRSWETQEEYNERMQGYDEEIAKKQQIEADKIKEENKRRRLEYLNTPEGSAKYEKIKKGDEGFFKNAKVHTVDTSALDKVAATTKTLNASNNKLHEDLQKNINTGIENQEQDKQDEINEYKLMGKSLMTAAELGFSGISLLGAVSNYNKWVNSSKKGLKLFANFLQKAQLPSQLGGTLIDGFQTIDAFNEGDTAEGIYNGISGLLGITGTFGAADIFRGQYPNVDRFLDVSGLTQNGLDYLKFGIEEATGVDSVFDLFRNNNNNHANGGPIKSYKDFSTRLSKAWGNQDISKDDYDYQKYYNDDPEAAYKQLESIEQGGKGHFPDSGKSGTYKTPNHPTYPDLGDKSWSNNDTVFHMSERQAFGDTDRILDYLGSDLNYNKGGTKVMYKDAYQLPSVIVTPKENYTELVPNRLHTGFVYEDSPFRAFGKGGYIPSSSIMKKISDWEGSSMKTNRSFDAEARDFNASLPQGATSRLTQQQLDGLYSYSYNVGAGNFRKRVVPILTNYLAGKSSIQDVQNSMWASKDSQLRGLAKRRAAERAMLDSYIPIDGSIINFNSDNIRQFLPSWGEGEQVVVSNNQVPVENIPSPFQPTEISEPRASIVDVFNMLNSIKSPRKINIYT